MKPAAKKSGEAGIILPELYLQRILLPIIGDSALICHAWTAKSKLQMLDKMMKRAEQAKAANMPSFSDRAPAAVVTIIRLETQKMEAQFKVCIGLGAQGLERMIRMLNPLMEVEVRNG
jgi:hypothetical protein